MLTVRPFIPCSSRHFKKGAKFAGSVGHLMTKMLSAFRGASPPDPLRLWGPKPPAVPGQNDDQLQKLERTKHPFTLGSPNLIELLKTKCMPVLLSGFEVCNLRKRDLYSLDFVVNRFFYEII